MIMFISLILLSGFFLLILFFPLDANAWGPATHLKLGLSVLQNLKILSKDTASLISNNSLSFLYGCISADIIQAKRFVEYVLNCHNWDNAFKLLRSAKSGELKAFSMGYLGHLAADIVAHNSYIPAKMIETYPKRGLKHFLWEMRFDSLMDDAETDRIIEDIGRKDFSLADDLMNGLLKTAIFSFKTNKRIFSGLLFIQRFKKWKYRLKGIGARDNYHLEKDEVEHYFRLSLDAMLGFFIDLKQSKYIDYDPMGKNALFEAGNTVKELKKRYGNLKETGEDIRKRADHFRNFFGHGSL